MSMSVQLFRRRDEKEGEREREKAFGVDPIRIVGTSHLSGDSVGCDEVCGFGLIVSKYRVMPKLKMRPRNTHVYSPRRYTDKNNIREI